MDFNTFIIVTTILSTHFFC